jgi:dipeptidyl aminopeptidase/acylaminoacyl peptidase
MLRAVLALSRCMGALSALALAGATASFAATPSIPLEQFAAGAEMEMPRISPDGKRLVYLSTLAGAQVVMLRELSSGRTRQLLRGAGGSFRVTLCDFKGDTRLLCHYQGVQRSRGGRPFPVSRLVTVNADGSDARVLFQNSVVNEHPLAQTQYQDRIVAWLPDDPEHVLIELAYQDGLFPAVYRLDVATGSLKVVVPARPPVIDWIADRAGNVRFGYGFRGSEAVYIAKSGLYGAWHTLGRFNRFDPERFEPLMFGALPNELFVFAPQQRRAAVWQMDLEEKHELQLVFSQPEVDVHAIIEWPPDGRVAGFQYETDRPHIFFIDPQAQSVERAMEQVLPGAYHLVVDGTPDGRRLLTMSFSDVMPPRYHLLDAAQGAPVEIGEDNAWLSHVRLAPMKPVTVPGPDGIRIPGYLTLPAGSQPGTPLPAVVFPHGGPHYRDSWGYDPLLQLMASRGYAVLQLNFRGSSGYGQEWSEAGHQAWGTVMNDDITAGAHWLVAQGIADPRRMCIVGWSYGGYAALIGVVKQPQLYRCAASIAGVSDLLQLAHDDARFYGGREAALESTGADKAELEAESPRRHADRIHVPILLVHGLDDTRVLDEQSREMARALDRSGVPHELVLIENGGHTLLGPEMRLTLYRALERFLAVNLQPP